jgi:hypothetical protein
MQTIQSTQQLQVSRPQTATNAFFKNRPLSGMSSASYISGSKVLGSSPRSFNNSLGQSGLRPGPVIGMHPTVISRAKFVEKSGKDGVVVFPDVPIESYIIEVVSTKDFYAEKTVNSPIRAPTD